jgi:NTP pyrophosphatase (non-canonical NTP hydrolase)
MSDISTEKTIYAFCILLANHGLKKRKLYDGADKPMGVDQALRYTTEELGEVASAITRERWELAKQECLDVAHAAMLLAFAIEREIHG